MSIERSIKYSAIKALFPQDKWDVGLLTEDQLKICAYSPIKGKAQEYGADFTNNIHFFSIVNSIVLVRHSPDSWDYSLDKRQTISSKRVTCKTGFPSTPISKWLQFSPDWV